MTGQILATFTAYRHDVSDQAAGATLKTSISLLCAASLLGACGSIVRGGDQDVSFTSEPAGAQVLMSNGQRCITPCALRLDRNDNHDGRVSLDGQSEPVDIDSTFGIASAGVLVSNVLLFGGVGIIIDAVTGAMFELDRDEVEVDFVGADRIPSTGTGVTFTDRTDTPAGLSFYEGASLSATPEDVRLSYCDAGWDQRIDQTNRTEYNPCTQSRYYTR
ncbi:MAG: hypothetical protein AAFR57_08030 [Pseudomonadota bacterium]